MSGSSHEAEGMRPPRVPPAFSVGAARWAPWLVALLTLLAILPALDGAGETAGTVDAPGLTLDEIFNIQTGVYLWRSALLEGVSLFTPEGAERVFGQIEYNPDHPPLGRLVIGAYHDLVSSSVQWHAPAPIYSLTSARTASALMFAVTIGVVGGFARRWYGGLAGVVAALSLALTPRAFGHAHLASLETAMGLTFCWTVLIVADRWSRCSSGGDAERSGIPWSAVLLGGVFFGLALLTKIQAVLLPIPIGLWCLWQWRVRAVPMMLVFGLIGGVTFFLGWPWLWLDPVEHLREYFGSKAQRPTLYCYYLGERFADVDVPWHYPFVMFLVTLPIGWLVLGALGAWPGRAETSGGAASRWEPRATLLAGVMLFVLAFFALPGITVYDGERLFLVVFPLWSVLVGRGAGRWIGSPPTDRVMSWKGRRAVTGAVGLMLLVGGAESVGGLVRLHPCHLSYYNGLVGGLGGADRLGLEPTYWRDSFTRSFLDEVAAAVPPGSTLYVAPVLHPANRLDLALLSPIVRHHGLPLDAYDDQDATKVGVMRYVLVFRRHADPWAALEPAPEGGELLAEVRRAGVQLAALYDLRPDR